MINQLMLPGELVRKRNEMIRAKINIEDLEGSRILASLIACISPNSLEIKDSYAIPVKDIISSKGGNSYKKIKGIVKKLIRSTFEAETTDPDGDFAILEFTFFSKIKYEKGIITASFNKEMNNFLIGLTRCFTQYNLLEYLSLSSTYSQRLFEILKSYSHKSEIEIPIEELHRQLSTPKSQVSNFGLFKKETLSKIHKEIISKTNFYFDYGPIKGGKGGRTSPVIAIRFIFSKKKIEPVKEKKEKEDKEKTVKNNNKNFFTAWNCVKSCKGNCDTLSKKPNKAACTICKTKNLLGEVLKNQEEHCSSEKTTPKKTTYKSGGVEVEQANFLYLVEQTKIQKKS